MKARADVAIVGLGLVGGSLARALSRAGVRVLGIDRAEVLRRARAARAVVETADDLAGAAGVPLVVLAAPPRANVALLRRAARVLPASTVITDLGSVKRPICRAARTFGLRRFVGGHPMAGNEGSGFAASDPDLFRGHPWILTAAGATPAAVAAVRRLVRRVGAHPVPLTPEAHDRTVAFLSHVPQLTAWALQAAAAGDRTAARNIALAGPGFRDMTRLAGSPRSLWREILVENRDEVARALSALQRALRRRV
jgi:prephenate dehydrogenase